MSDNGQQSINIAEFANLCAGNRIAFNQAIHSWASNPDLKRDRPHAMGLGSSGEILSKAEVARLFAEGVIALDPQKIQMTFNAVILGNIKEKYGFTNADLGLAANG